MGWIFAIIMLICCAINFDGSFLIAASIFGLAGAIERLADVISSVNVKIGSVKYGTKDEKN